MKNLENISISALLLFCAVLYLSFKPAAKIKLKPHWQAINDSVYACAFETSVVDYLEFLFEKCQDESCKSLYCSDSTVWDNFQRLQGISDPENFVHPSFYAHPIMGLSHSQAKAYCAWLTDYMNKNPKRPFDKILYRLPTETEWEQAAAADIANPEFPWELPPDEETIQLTQDKKGKYRCNFKVMDQTSIFIEPEANKYMLKKGKPKLYKDGYEFTAPVKSYKPNPWRIYNMAGNIAEMIDRPGIAKGGSWNSTGYYLRIKSQEKYEKPSSKVGFRIFMEVLEK